MKLFFRKDLKEATVALLAVVLSGCTTTNPYTGEQQIDYGATAGVAGLALGATALAVAASKDDDRRDVVVIDRRPGYGGGAYRPYRPYGYGRNVHRVRRYRR